MPIEQLRDFFGLCAAINMGLLLWWWLFFALAHDWVYKMHGKFFKIGPEQFDAIHYQSMAYFKLTIFLFSIVPYLALHILG